MVNQELQFLATIGLIYETFIIALFAIILVLSFKKYKQKKHELTFYLILIFLNFTIAIIFSWISKLLVITIGLEYNHIDYEPVDESNPIYWFLLRIADFRISYLFVIFSIYISYILRIKLFDENPKPKQKILIILYTIFTAAFTFFIYQRSNSIYDTFTFFFVFLLMFIVYIPFLSKTYKAYKSVIDKVYKKGFLALSLLSIFYILVLFSFFIDRMLTLIPAFELGFTLFYYLGWIFCAAASICAYFGYIKPRTQS
jgi:hypothetical protein